MSFRAMVLRRSLTLLFFTGIALLSARAAGPNSPIIFADHDGIVVSLVASPNFGGTGNGSSLNADSSQWLKIEFHYSVVPRTTTPFVDSAEFKIWIEGRDMYAANTPGKDGLAVGLTGSVTYVNIAAARDAYGVFYVHPSTLARYGTLRGGTDDFLRKFNIHMEVTANGAESDWYNKSPDAQGRDWYKALHAVDGLVFRQDQSPFTMADVNTYPAIKLPAPAASSAP